MTHEAQRIAIAEECGWNHFDNREWGQHWERDNIIARFWQLPDYLNDLNAMHEAEKTIPDDLLLRYATELALLTNSDAEWLSASAGKRAEALLRTIGKWGAT